MFSEHNDPNREPLWRQAIKAWLAFVTLRFAFKVFGRVFAVVMLPLLAVIVVGTVGSTASLVGASVDRLEPALRAQAPLSEDERFDRALSATGPCETWSPRYDGSDRVLSCGPRRVRIRRFLTTPQTEAWISRKPGSSRIWRMSFADEDRGIELRSPSPEQTRRMWRKLHRACGCLPR